MKSRLKSVIILVLVIAAIIGFFGFARFFGSGEKVESEKPLVICNPPATLSEQQKCFWTAHIHAHVQIFKDGKEMPLSFEQGELEKSHTHSEKNKIHWHGLIPVGPDTKEIKDWSFFKIENLLRDLKLSIDGSAEFFAHDKKVDPSYIWQDGDHIEIHY